MENQPNEQNQQSYQQEQQVAPEMPEAPAPRRRFWKFALWFIAIVVVVLAAASLADYLSPSSRYAREMQRNYEQYQQSVNVMEETLRNDTYGGKTPQETLDMFVDALKKGDVKLASEYFAFETGGADAFNRKKWEDGLNKAKEGGRLEEIISFILETKPKGYSESYTWYKKSFSFESLNADGSVKNSVELVYNHLSGVWKIESL